MFTNNRMTKERRKEKEERKKREKEEWTERAKVGSRKERDGWKRSSKMILHVTTIRAPRDSRGNMKSHGGKPTTELEPNIQLPERTPFRFPALALCMRRRWRLAGRAPSQQHAANPCISTPPFYIDADMCCYRREDPPTHTWNVTRSLLCRVYLLPRRQHLMHTFKSEQLFTQSFVASLLRYR